MIKSVTAWVGYGGNLKATELDAILDILANRPSFAAAIRGDRDEAADSTRHAILRAAEMIKATKKK